MDENKLSDTDVSKPVSDAGADTKPEVFNASVPPTVPPQPEPTRTPESPAAMPKQIGGGKKLGGKLFVLVAVGILLLAGGASAYFGYVLPNKPENVWKKALTNTSRGYDKLIEYGDEKKAASGLRADGNYRVEASEVVVDGSFESRSDRKNSLTKLDVGFSGTRMNLEVRSTIPDNTTYPDIYLKANGLDSLTSLLGPEYGQFASSLEDQWYVVDHTLFDQLAQQTVGEETDEMATLTPEEVVEVLKAVGRVNKDYLFNTAEDKAVFDASEYVGKEEQDGRSVHHYKVGVRKENLKKYVTALRDELKNTPLTKLVKDQSFDEFFNLDEMTKEIDSFDESKKVDVWVDASTKLVRTVRIFDEDNQNTYFDIGLKYTGGDEFPFYLSVRGDEDDVKGKIDLVLSLNTKEDRVKVQFDMDVQGSSPVKATAQATIKLSDETVEFTKPEGAKSVMELFGGFMGGFQQQSSDQAELQEEYLRQLEAQGIEFDY